jgi:hypothetical protein
MDQIARAAHFQLRHRVKSASGNHFTFADVVLSLARHDIVGPGSGLNLPMNGLTVGDVEPATVSETAAFFDPIYARRLRAPTRRMVGGCRPDYSLMQDLGINAQVVRAAVTRKNHGGLRSSSSHASVAAYALAPMASKILDQSDRSILAARVPVLSRGRSPSRLGP